MPSGTAASPTSDGTPTVGESYNFREMRPIYAREWVVILTNYAYMMTTPEYKYVMANFKKVMGGDLYDNEKVPFTAEKYQSEMERFKAKKNFVLGQTSPAYGGLGRRCHLGHYRLGTSTAIMHPSADGSRSPTSSCTAWITATTVT